MQSYLLPSKPNSLNKAQSWALCDIKHGRVTRVLTRAEKGTRKKHISNSGSFTAFSLRGRVGWGTLLDSKWSRQVTVTDVRHHLLRNPALFVCSFIKEPKLVCN